MYELICIYIVNLCVLLTFSEMSSQPSLRFFFSSSLGCGYTLEKKKFKQYR